MESEKNYEQHLMGAYRADRRNLGALQDLTFKAVSQDPQTGNTVFTFNNEYRRINVDLVFKGGRLFVTDFYGDGMDPAEKRLCYFGDFDY